MTKENHAPNKHLVVIGQNNDRGTWDVRCLTCMFTAAPLASEEDAENMSRDHVEYVGRTAAQIIREDRDAWHD